MPCRHVPNSRHTHRSFKIAFLDVDDTGSRETYRPTTVKRLFVASTEPGKNVTPGSIDSKLCSTAPIFNSKVQEELFSC
jgi:hypothetical protein